MTSLLDNIRSGMHRYLLVVMLCLTGSATNFSEVKAITASSVNTDNSRSQLFSIESYSNRAMSFSGAGYWMSHDLYPVNPATTQYLNQTTVLSGSFVGVNYSEDLTDYFNGLSKGLHIPIDSDLMDRGPFQQQVHWNPYYNRGRSWLLLVTTLLDKHFSIERVDTLSNRTDPLVLVDASVFHSADIGIRFAQSRELINESSFGLSVGYSVDFVFNTLTPGEVYSGRGGSAGRFLNPFPDEISKMQTRIGYAVDAGFAGVIPLYRLKYSLLVEDLIGQFHYVATHPSYHLGVSWDAIAGGMGKARNLSIGIEFQRMGEHAFDKALHVGSELLLADYSIRGGISHLGTSVGLGMRKNWFGFNYAYYPDSDPDLSADPQRTTRRHGIEIFILRDQQKP